ncbi:MAG: hypothetical protein ACKVVP_11230 [Chloroflexota bacterium]
MPTRYALLLAALVIVTAVYLFWSRNVITRAPGYTTPLGETPTTLRTPER